MDDNFQLRPDHDSVSFGGVCPPQLNLAGSLKV